MFLTKFASKVTVVHRRDTWRASKIVQDKARANPKIEWRLNTGVAAINDTGKGEVTSMVLRDVHTGATSELPVTVAGTDCMAALDAERYLEGHQP